MCMWHSHVMFKMVTLNGEYLRGEKLSGLAMLILNWMLIRNKTENSDAQLLMFELYYFTR
jgi:hypothetical protein